MEALFSRGGYPIHHRVNGFNDVFRRNDDGDYVCSVLSGEHRQMMVKSGNFRAYAPKVKVPTLPDAPIISTRPKESPAGVVPEVKEPATEPEAPQEAGTPEEPKAKPRRGGRRKKA